jgi:cobalt-zinc-cadmium efflux system outer membrane protein
MTTRIVLSVLIAALMSPAAADAQAPRDTRVAERYVDPVTGLSLEQAIARALEQEPSLRAARSEIDVARGMRLQASRRPNPNVSFERREEPGGTDNVTTVAVEWPLDLFRRSGRVAVADREVTAVQLAVADRERMLAAEVRMRYATSLRQYEIWPSSRSSWRPRDGSTNGLDPESQKGQRHPSSATCWTSSCAASNPIACCWPDGRRPHYSS